MISRLAKAKSIPNASQGFALTFGAEPFDHDAELTWLSPSELAEEFSCSLSQLPGNGNWFRGLAFGEQMVGWLCPALFCYFDQAPTKIYVKGEPLPAGFDPIWHVAADDPRARRFVSAQGGL